MKSWKKPTPDQVSRALVQLGQDAHRRYFFDRLSNPEWIAALRDKGVFRHPPKLVRDDAKGTVAIPPWPEARYLARMATLEPSLVRDVIAEVPDEGNVSVYEDFADATVAMPPEVSVTLIEKAKKWAQAPYQFLLSEKLADLGVKLAEAGFQEPALDLFRALLRVLPDARKRAPQIDGDEIALPPEPTSRIDSWRYEQILTKAVPKLVAAVGLGAVAMLCDLLEDAVRLSLRDPAKSAPEDLSHIWRPAVEDHPQNSVPGLKSLLVSAVRAAALQSIEKDSGQLEALVAVLRARATNWRIFTRLILHVLCTVVDPPMSLVSFVLTNHDLFDSSTCRHEYVQLLRKHFRNLAGDDRAKIMSWIQNPPSVEEFKTWHRGLFGKDLPDAQALLHAKTWQRDWLARLGDSIPEEWLPRFKELVTETGEPQHPDFPSFTTSFVGPSSPKTSQELAEMSVRDLVEYFRTWQPSNRFMGASREGLGTQLSSRVSEEPQRFASESLAFVGLHPTYVRSLINGLTEAVGKKKEFDWRPVLLLCDWVLEQKDERAVGEAPYWVEEDKDWTWTRTAIAHLIEAALRQQTDVIPFALQKAVWAVLERLSDDPNPTPEHEARYGGSNQDPVNMAINTTRGVALLSVTYYATWVRKNIEGFADGKERVARGFDEMPEVRRVLEKHLDPEVDPSLAVRSTYGMRFPWIHLIDPSWATQNAARIFPKDPSQRRLWEASWEAYLNFCNPYDDVLEPLVEHYRTAIERLREPDAPERKSANPEAQLAAHLMGYYWRGKLSIDGDDGLIRGFFANAPEKAKAYAVETIGRWLFQIKQAKESVEPSAQKRLVTLWQWRLDEARTSSNPSMFAREAIAFGWWFRSGVFNAEWVIEQLELALMVASGGASEIFEHGSYAILEPLAEASQQFPLRAVRCLDLLSASGHRSPHIFFSFAEVRPILENAMKAGGDAAEIATRLINELGRRGNMQFRDLLRS